VFRKLPRLQQGKWQSVGRLDLNTEGLLLFTSSGELANQLMHPRFGLEREYAVRVLGALSAEEKKRLLEGVRLDDGMAPVRPHRGGRRRRLQLLVPASPSPRAATARVRRLFESVGHAVSRLIRIRYGAMVLPRGLKRGAWIGARRARHPGPVPGAAGAGGERAPRHGAAPKGQGPAQGQRRAQPQSQAPGQPQQRGGQGEARESIPNPLAHGPGARPDRGGGKGPPQGRRGNRGDRPPGQGPGPGPQGRNRQGDDRAPGGANQPDPMKTSLGYIGTDSFSRQRKEQRQGPRRGGPGGSGGGGGGGGGNFGGGGGGGRRRGPLNSANRRGLSLACGEGTLPRRLKSEALSRLATRMLRP